MAYQEGDVVSNAQGEQLVLQNNQWVPVQQNAPQPQQPPQSIGDQLTRQLGLTARHGIEGLLSLPNLLAEVPRQALNLIPGVNFPPQQQNLSNLLTQAGLPSPETPIERVAAGGAQALAGGGGMIGAGKAIAGAAPTISSILTTAPGVQALTAGTGGVAGQTAAEMGVGPVGQVAASMAAGLGAGMLTPKVGLFSKPSAAKERITQLIKEGVPDAETAGFKLQPQAEKLTKVKISVTPQKVGMIKWLSPTQKIERTIAQNTPRLVKDKVAQEAIKQGFDDGVIAAVKGGSRSDKRMMMRMADIMERGKKNALYATENRPTDVLGDSLMRRFSVIQRANSKAGGMIDRVAKSLKGDVDPTPATNKFYGSLDDMGVTIAQTDEGVVLDFAKSDIADLDGPIRVVNHVFNRLKSIDSRNPQELHRLKRFIGEHVSYGKNAEGLAGKAEIVLKGLRRDIDSILDDKFPRYNKVNSAYSETIDVLDDFQDIAGRKIDLTGPNVEKAVGQIMRGVMSNNKSRVRLLDSVNSIEKTAVKYGGKYDDNLMTQAVFADELDSMFGPVARTSFQGQIGQAVERAGRAAVSPKEEAIGMIGKGVEKMRGINQENAFSTIKELLRQ